MLFQRRKHTARRRWRLSVKLLIASSVATVIGFSAICASVMLDMRRGEEQLARQMLENLASSIDADIGRNIELYDLSLRAVASNMVMPEIKDVSRPILHLILFDHAATAKHFGAIQVFDTTGRLTIDASSLDPRPENRADEEYFTVHRDNPNAGLFISKPMLHRGAYSVVLSRRITAEHGDFLGVVAGSIRFSYFHELFDRLNLDRDDSITVLRRDRTIIMRKPFDLDFIGKNSARPSARWNPAKLKGRRLIRRTRSDRCDIPRLFVRRDASRPALRRGRQAAGGGVQPLAQGSDARRRHHGGADPVRVRHHAVSGARDRPPRRRRSQAGGACDHRRAHRPAQPPQVRRRDRQRMAARRPAADAAGAADDRRRSFQGLQRHPRPPGRRPGAGRNRDLHFRFGAPRRRLRRTLWRRGIRGAAAGMQRDRRVQSWPRRSARRSCSGRKGPPSTPSASASPA